MKLINRKNNLYTLANTPFAKGGEGSVYDISGNTSLVAKIYHKNGRTDEKHRKILAMLDSPPKGITDQIAWPVDILYTQSREFMGFVMPRIKNTTKIDSLYSYDNRNSHNFSFYLQVAQNLAAAVLAVHNSGHVCGDLNPANICVDPKTALITLVDTDSYHIKASDGSLYKCPVCRPEYVPREIQNIMNTGKSLRDTTASTFTIYTDYFAVAIHIFALLMNGAHPYSCVVSSSYSASQFNIVRNIEQSIYPYEKNNYGFTPPKYAPSINCLPSEIIILFQKMFGKMATLSPTNRPSVSDFFHAISKFELNLNQCTNNRTHQFYNKNKDCPLCAATTRVNKLISAAPPAITQNRYVYTLPPLNTTTTATPPTNKPSYSGYNYGFSYYLGAFLAFIFWAVAQFFLVIYAIDFFTGISFFWGWLIMVVAIGIIPFIPMWLFALFYFPFDLDYYDFFSGVAATLNYSKYLAYVSYSIVAIVISWGSLFDVILSPILICIPVSIISKIIPDFTTDFLL